jgi:DNA gyrase/topoisomerase IV subunit B
MEERFGGDMEIMEEAGIKIAIMPNPTDDFNFLHFINGINVYEGGNPLNWVMSQLLSPLKELLEKKLKLKKKILSLAQK